MISNRDSLVRRRPGLLAVAFCLLPGLAMADTVQFRNECKASVIVQTSTVIRGMVIRDQPSLLRPGDASPKFALKNDKIVTVYDARTNRILCREVLKASLVPVAISIEPDKDPRVPKVQLKQEQ